LSWELLCPEEQIFNRAADLRRPYGSTLRRSATGKTFLFVNQKIVDAPVAGKTPGIPLLGVLRLS